MLFAKGVVTYFHAPNTVPNAEVVKKALGFFQRAVVVLEKTHGREAIWTLAATYRMAVCLFDLGEYEEAMSVQTLPPPLFQLTSITCHPSLNSDLVLPTLSSIPRKQNHN